MNWKLKWENPNSAWFWLWIRESFEVEITNEAEKRRNSDRSEGESVREGDASYIVVGTLCYSQQ